ncbi:MAG: glycoside hydrolase 100 family protein [Chromatiales bacterium]
MDHAARSPDTDRDEGRTRALDLLRRCSHEEGFIASPCRHDNYRRIWSRDGVVTGLAALGSGEQDLIDTFRHTLLSLGQHQGPHGEIPSNIGLDSGRVSYGSTVGRVDSDLWFVIGCGQYWRVTGDRAFLTLVHPLLERVRYLLGAWELNNRGLLYVPQTGDWADEYIQSGYVLFDQVLYLQAQRELLTVREAVTGHRDPELAQRIERLRRMIRANFWFTQETAREDIYHPVLFEQGKTAFRHCAGKRWLPYFAPQGYGYRFDALANVLVSLLGVADEDQSRQVDRYIDEEVVSPSLPLLPAFHPVITPRDEDWKELQVTFSYTFKNRPYEYQNGGLWPMITGFYVADLAGRGETSAAKRFLRAIHRGDALSFEGKPWGFPEYVHGRRLTAGGARQLAWSAAALLIGEQALEGRPPFLDSVADGRSAP